MGSSEPTLTIYFDIISYVCLHCETERRFFEGVCAPDSPTTYFRAPPPPCNTLRAGVPLPGLRFEVDTYRATVSGALAQGRRKPQP